MSRRRRHRLFVQCVPGLERLLEAELRAFGLRTGRRIRGGVEAEGSMRDLYLVNHRSRLATRVLLRVAHFDAHSFSDLERGIDAIDWGPYIAGGGVVVRAASVASTLYHTDAIAERVAARFDGTQRGEPSQRLHVRLHRDRAAVSVDTSGDALHHRGWREGAAKAPLRSTLAAALLAAGEYDGRSPVIDPFCGSGTIPIEAGLWSAGRSPRVGRDYACQRWPSFEPGTWASVTAGAEDTPASVVASDRDAGAVATTTANAARAQIPVTAVLRSISDLVPPAGGPGWLVTNPPYGRRVRAADPRDLHARLGQVVRRQLPGWTVVLLTDDVAAAGHSGLPLEPRLSFDNGGIAVQALVGRVPDH